MHNQDAENTAGRIVWPMGLVWSATLAGVVSLFWQAPAQGTEPLRLDQFSNIEAVALAPDQITAAAPTSQGLSQRPVQRGRPAAQVIAPLDTYRLWPDSTLASMYDSHWNAIQSAPGDEALALEQRMSAIWRVLDERGVTGIVAGPELAKVTAFLTETSAH